MVGLGAAVGLWQGFAVDSGEQRPMKAGFSDRGRAAERLTAALSAACSVARVSGVASPLIGQRVASIWAASHRFLFVFRNGRWLVKDGAALDEPDRTTHGHAA